MAIKPKPHFGRAIERITFFLFALLYSVSAYGGTCFYDEKAEKATKKLSKIYLEKIRFSVESSGQEIDAVLELPSQIDGADVSRVLIVKMVPNVKDKTEFIFPLDVRKDDGKAIVYYMLSGNMSDHNLIQVSIGPCRVIEYELDYRAEKLRLRSSIGSK